MSDQRNETDEWPEAEPPFAGHDDDNGMLHLTIPEVAGAQTLAQANATGSPRARRQAKLMAWLLVFVFVAPIVGGLLYTALS